MKILMRLFLIMLVMFSYAFGLGKTLQRVVDADVNNWKNIIRNLERKQNFYKKRPPTSSRAKAYAKKIDKDLAWRKKEFSKLRKVLKNNPQDMYRRYKEGRIAALKKQLQNNKGKPYPRAFAQWNHEIKALEKDYNDYLASIKPKTIKINPQKKPATKTFVNTSKKPHSKVILKASQLTTKTNASTINIAGKAKASVGSVSIGKE